MLQCLGFARELNKTRSLCSQQAVNSSQSGLHIRIIEHLYTKASLQPTIISELAGNE